MQNHSFSNGPPLTERSWSLRSCEAQAMQSWPSDLCKPVHRFPRAIDGRPLLLCQGRHRVRHRHRHQMRSGGREAERPLCERARFRDGKRDYGNHCGFHAGVAAGAHDVVRASSAVQDATERAGAILLVLPRQCLPESARRCALMASCKTLCNRRDTSCKKDTSLPALGRRCARGPSLRTAPAQMHVRACLEPSNRSPSLIPF